MSEPADADDRGARAALALLGVSQLVFTGLELLIAVLIKWMESSNASSDRWKSLEPFFHVTSIFFLLAELAAVAGVLLLARAATGKMRTLGVAAAVAFLPLAALIASELVGHRPEGRYYSLAAFACDTAAWTLVVCVASARAGRGLASPAALAALGAIQVQLALDLLIRAGVFHAWDAFDLLRPLAQLVTGAAVVRVLVGARSGAPPVPALPTAVDARWSPVAGGVATLGVLAVVRVPVAILGGVLLSVAVATKSGDSAEALVLLLALVGGITTLLAVVNAVRVARAPEDAGAPAGLAAAGMGIALLVDGYATSLNLTVLKGLGAHSSSMWDSGFDDAMRAYDAAKILPWVSIASGALGVACSLALFAALGRIARAVGQTELSTDAARGRNLSLAAVALLFVAAVVVSEAPPLALILALPALVLGVMALVAFVAVAAKLAARLRAPAPAA